MNREQFEEYRAKNEALEDIREFCEWCGKRYKDNWISKPFFYIVTLGGIFKLRKRYHGFTNKENTYEIPIELQDRIIDVIEAYLDEKERELERL